MARATVPQVREIITTDISDEVITNNFLATANLLVEEHLVPSDCAYSEGLLAAIEAWLAAHFIAMATEEGNIKYTKLGDAAESYDVATYGEGLNGTRYGQVALTLDKCGTLQALTSTKLRARFRVV